MARATKRITIEVVAQLQPGEIAWDSVVRGFGVRARARCKRYFLKTRVRGRPVWIKIGDAGAWTPNAARTEAMRLLREITGGTPLARIRVNPTGLPTVESLADRYLAEHAEIQNKPGSVARFRDLVQRKIKPGIGRRLVMDLSTAEVARWHMGLRATPRSANMALSVLSKMMSLAERWELRDRGSNPCRGIQRFPERPRSRFLSDAELERLGITLREMRAAGDLLPGAALALLLAALTGCRIGEIIGLRWDDVDLEAGAFEIREAKAGARRHAIGAAVVALLKAEARHGPWVVWTADPRKPAVLNTIQHAWRNVRRGAGLDDVRIHDLRHGFGTFASEAGANAFLIRDALGHKTMAMTARYVSRSEDPLRKLADHVAGRVAGALGVTPKEE